MNSKNILVSVFVIVGIIGGALYLGVAAGTQDIMTNIIFVALVIAVAIFAILKEDMWVIVPVLSVWGGTVPILPIPFGVSNLAVGFATLAWVLFIATRRMGFRFHFTAIDFWVVLLLMVLAAGYFRNPVGLASFALGANVGARPYAEVLIGVVGYLMLSNQFSRSDFLKRLPKWVVFSALAIAVGGGIAMVLPEVGIYMYQFYSGFKPSLADILDPNAPASENVGRASFLRPLSEALMALVCATLIPLKLLNPRYFLWALLAGAAVVLALVSGFRVSLITVVFFFIAGSWLWLGLKGLIACTGLAIVGIISILTVQTIYPLPERIQRPLTILPGDWDEMVKREAQSSVDWRVDMWMEILEGDMVGNRWIGDGFGFPRQEMAYYGELQKTGQISPQELAEFYLINGNLHSGPLSSLKYAGWIGFVFYMGLSLTIAIKYVKLWRRIYRQDRSSVFLLPVGFFAIMAVYDPFKFVFIFGDFKTYFPALLISAGIYRVLENTWRKELVENQQQAEESAQKPKVAPLRRNAPRPLSLT